MINKKRDTKSSHSYLLKVSILTKSKKVLTDRQNMASSQMNKIKGKSYGRGSTIYAESLKFIL